MPNIAFDLRTTHFTGIYRYGLNILKHLIPLYENSDIKLYVLHNSNSLVSKTTDIKKLSRNNKVTLIPVLDDYKFVRDSRWLRNWLVDEQINTLYSFNYTVDVKCPVRYIYTIHDLVRLKYPLYSYDDNSFEKKFGKEEFEKLKQILRQIEEKDDLSCTSAEDNAIIYRYFQAINLYLSKNSVCIVTVSKAVKEDIVNLLGVSIEKIFVIPGAVETNIFHRKSASAITLTLNKFSIPENYCLYVGLNHPHKRLSYLINIIAEKRDLIPTKSRLVIVAPHREMFSSIINLIKSQNWSDFVTILFAVSDEELACLYSNAKALIISSIEEGFCLPALESLMCGTEVIIPDIKALRETVGCAGHFYPVNDKDMLGNLLISAFNNSLDKKANTFINRFSWENSAKYLFDLLKTVDS